MIECFFRKRRKSFVLSASLWVLFGTIAYTQSETVRVESLPNPRQGNNTGIIAPDDFIDESERAKISQAIQVLAERTAGVELAVAVLPSIGDQSPKDFAVDLFKHWQLGEAGRDNGLLLLVVQDVRRWEIEVGYGLEGDLPDVIVKRLGEEHLVPSFRNHQPGVGLLNLIQAITTQLTGEPIPNSFNTDSAAQRTPAPSPTSGIDWSFALALKTAHNHLQDPIIPAPEEYYLKEIHPWGLTGSEIYQGLSTSKNLGLIIALLGFLLMVITLVLKKKFYLYGTILLLLTYCATGWFLVQSETPWLILGIGYVAGGLVLGLEFWLRGKLIIDSKEPNPSLYEQLSQVALWGSVNVVFYPYLFPLISRWKARRINEVRHLIQQCGQCQKLMRKLSESEEDVRLTLGQQTEESIGSVDYDVWICPNLHTQLIPHDPERGSFRVCEACHFRTEYETQREVLQAATYDRSGSARVTYQCGHCKKTKVIQQSLPQLTKNRSTGSYSSSSSFSDSSSRSSSSSGGGTSGGAGAGGNL